MNEIDRREVATFLAMTRPEDGVRSYLKGVDRFVLNALVTFAKEDLLAEVERLESLPPSEQSETTATALERARMKVRLLDEEFYSRPPPPTA